MGETKKHFLLEEYLKSVLPEPFLVSLLGAFPRFFTLGCEEIRLRLDRSASVTLEGKNHLIHYRATQRELMDLLTTFCRGSVYAYRETIKCGYVPLPYGLRLGVVGHAVLDGGEVSGVSGVSALVIRLARRVDGVAEELVGRWREWGCCGLLVCAPPGGGKTTLLKDFILRVASGKEALRVAVVDSRGELCPDALGDLVDVLEGYPQAAGLEIALRTLSPEVIVCDEIGKGEVESVLHICHSGIPLVASLHARHYEDLTRRTVGRRLLDTGAFGGICYITRDEEGFHTHMEAYVC